MLTLSILAVDTLVKYPMPSEACYTPNINDI